MRLLAPPLLLPEIWTQPPAHYFTQASLLTEPLRACQRLTDWDLAMVNC